MSAIPLLDHSDHGHKLLGMSDVCIVPNCYVLRRVCRYPALHHGIRYKIAPSLAIKGRHHIDFKVSEGDRDGLAISADLWGCRICTLKDSLNTIEQVGKPVGGVVAGIKDYK